MFFPTIPATISFMLSMCFMIMNTTHSLMFTFSIKGPTP